MQKIIQSTRLVHYDERIQNLVMSAFGPESKMITDGYSEKIEVFHIEFSVNVRKWVGYVVLPKESISNNAIVYCRWGTGEIWKLNIAQAFTILGKFANRGYAVFAPQYAGIGGSEGADEIGWQDLEDVLVWPEILTEILGKVPEKIGIFSESRGAVMAYKSLACSDWIHALVVRGGLSNLESVAKLRPEMIEAWSPHFSQTPQEYRKRSVICWPEKLPKNVPILLLHGLCDWRVSPKDSLDLSGIFLENRIPHRLICFENADHALSQVADEAWDMIFDWFDRFLQKNESAPKVWEPKDRDEG